MAKQDIRKRLHDQVLAVCPIVGVAIGTFGVSSSVVISFDPAATAGQRTAAQGVVNAFDWSDAAQATYDNLQQRTAASNCVTESSAAGKLERATAGVLVDEINSLRQWITSFKAAVAAATTFADLKTRVAALANTPDRTLAQAKTAIQGKATSGAAD